MFAFFVTLVHFFKSVIIVLLLIICVSFFEQIYGEAEHLVAATVTVINNNTIIMSLVCSINQIHAQFVVRQTC